MDSSGEAVGEVTKDEEVEEKGEVVREVRVMSEMRISPPGDDANPNEEISLRGKD